MSTQQKAQIKCPKCGADGEIILLQAVNSQVDPELKEKLLEGKLFRYTCPKCGAVSALNYGLLYHDMEHMAMVHYVEPEKVDTVLAMLEDLKKGKAGAPLPEGYRLRVVTGQNELREKALIFDQGLDDRVMELVKLMYLINANDKYPDHKLNNVYFLAQDGKYILEFVGEKPLFAEIPTETYHDIGRQFEAKLARADPNEHIIDLAWANKLMLTEEPDPTREP